jgi:type II secretory pathway pseudopilin PulG
MVSSTSLPSSDGPVDDEGFGLVEVVVSIFLLAVLAMGLLPGIVNGLKQSAGNITITAATQMVDEQIDLAVSSGSTCSTIRDLASSKSTTDSRGVSLSRTTATAVSASPATACPVAATAYPTTVLVSVSVTRAGSATAVASASTLVYVDAP